MRSLYTVCAVIFSFVLIAVPAAAQSLSGLDFPHDHYAISLVRAPHLAANEVALRVSSPVAVYGCFGIEAPEITESVEAPYMTIEVSTPRLVNDETPRYGQGVCQSEGSFIVSDVTLNRDKILDQEIEKLVLKSGVMSDTYDIEIDEEHIRLSSTAPETFKRQENSGKSDPLAYWFLPDETVVLRVPMAKKEHVVYPQVKELALKRGLVPLSTILGNFDQPEDSTGRFYFADPSGIVREEIGEENSVAFGKVAVFGNYTGIDGVYSAGDMLDVMAQKPGSYD